MKVIEINTSGNVSEFEVTDDIGEQIRNRLDGWIEVVKPERLDSEYIMIADEEGLLKELRINLFGSYLYETEKHGFPIAGNIYIATVGYTDDGEFDIMGLSDDAVQKFYGKYREIIDKFKIINN